MDESRTQASEGGTNMAERYTGPSAEADRRPAFAPGQLRAGLVLDDDDDLSRRQVGRAGVQAEAGRRGHRRAVPHRGLLTRCGADPSGVARWPAHLDGV